jgi:hypothetical protein
MNLHGRAAIDRGLLLVMVLPNLVWVLLGRSHWVSDSSLYALDATKLNHTLLFDASSWWSAMLAVSPKPPILPWIGQFFVTVGRLLGDIDVGLLLIILAAHYAGLWLLYEALLDGLHDRSLAMLGCLLVASAPTFIVASTKFYVQPVQLFVVCWFLWAMVASRAWDAWLTLLHLAAASAVGLLTTMSSPAYCLVPGAIALAHAWTNRTKPIRIRPAHGIAALLAAVSLALALAWYLRHVDEAIAYAEYGYSFFYAAEVEDIYPIKLAEWCRLLLFGLSFSALASLSLPWALLTRTRNETRPRSRESAVVVLLAAQIALVLLMLASSAHQTARYLLPLAPYFAAISMWSVSKIDGTWLKRALAVALSLQLVSTNVGLYTSGGGYLARERARYVAALDAITRVIANEPRAAVWLGIGELGVYNFDLAYHAAKSPDFRHDHGPEYHSIEIELTSTAIDGNVDVLWKQLESARESYVVLLRDPPPLGERDPHDVWQTVIAGTRDISHRIRRSPNFERMSTPDSWEVEIYRDVTPVETPAPASPGRGAGEGR